MKTKIIGLLIGLIGLFGLTFAGDLAGFSVSVNPSTVKVGEPADLTIKALDSNGDVLTDYKGDIIITVTDKDWNDLDITDYVVPNDGTYEFTDEDQGVKTFTKGLIINKAGDFYVKVEDFDTGKSGQAPIKVVSSDAALNEGKVKIITPSKNEIITSDTLTVAGQAKNYKNSKVQVLIDKKVVAEGLVGNDGSFQIDVSDIKNWDHTLQVQVLDLNNKVVAKSDEIPFTAKVNETLFKKIEILPSNQVSQGTKVTVNVSVDSKVNSAVLHITNYGDFPMDRASTTSFTTQLVANTPGKFDVNLTLTTADGKTKNYDNIAKLVVLEKIGIGAVQFDRDNHENKIDLTWKFTGQIPAFKVEYGTGKNALTNSKIVKENKFTIENIDSALTYYVKITPVDANGNQIGDSSKLIVIEPNMQKAATCKIDNIKVNVVRKNGSNYLVWDKVPGASKYIVYEGDTSDKLTATATVTGTSYKLPFDPNAKKVKYSYFAVKASCDDGSLKQIGNVKKVKTGPLDWLIYALIISMIVYGLKLTFSE